MSQPIQLPHAVDDVVVVCVDAVRRQVRVPGKVALHDPLVRNRADEFFRIEVVIDAGDIHVVDIQQQPTVRVFGHACEEFPFGERRVGEVHITAGILQHERPFQKILDDANSLDDVPQRRFVERHGEQVVRIASGHAGPAEMIRHPVSIHGFGEFLQPAQVVEVERISAADRQRHTVCHDRISLGDLLQHGTGSAVRVHVVFGNDLEPIDVRFLFKDVRVVDGSQTDSQTEIRVAETW